ncbi:MAG: tRNA1(Val) (adenine(37)-N6)-methyltransferase [Lachnospiraceae bacterium]|jgi:tRNA1Val (adenine37-N6)-methyltransferase|nr:tRNA1(Val) (adenine(37)-N6)-methyltransferase [Lachnospiraceae bacterium]
MKNIDNENGSIILTEEQKKLVNQGERVDTLERNGLVLLQNPKKFCFGMDAVLLSGFACIKPEEKVLDMGTGNGIIPILLSAKTKAKEIYGLEIQEEVRDMADRSVRINSLEDRVHIISGDIRDASKRFGASSFDVITSNPPYMIDQHGIRNKEDAKYIARHEALCTLKDIMGEAAKILKPKGRCYLVYRPFRLAELFMEMKSVGIEPKKMRLVHPFMDKEPNMVLVEGIRGANPRLTVEKPLIVYESEGKYTKEILDIYGF